MKLYFAPMEGITGYLYRNVVWKQFPDVDKLYAPFIQPNEKHIFVPKEKRDILPENNQGVPLVPQVLTSSAEGFIRAGKELEAYGYREVNLNLGCPSGTVVSKGKGAGMLADMDKLRQFFDTVFSVDWKAEISVKTRLGMTEKDDFRMLFDLFREFPISELIVHPRYQKDFYKGVPRLGLLEEALMKNQNADIENPDRHALCICYNGNIFTRTDYDCLLNRMQAPDIKSVMLGRGLLMNPALAREIRGGRVLVKEELRTLHDALFDGYRQADFGETNTLFKMKELWNYWGLLFGENGRELKKVRKANRLAEYKTAVDCLFQIGELTKAPAGL